MESARKVINLFLKTKFNPNDLKSELYKAGEAAKEEGWTFMDASFQLGGKARDEGLSPDEVEQVLRRAFSSEKRSSEREEVRQEAPAAAAAPAGQGPVVESMPKPTIISPLPTGMISMEQMLALGLDTQSMELLQNFKIDPEALSIPWPAADWRKDLAKLLKDNPGKIPLSIMLHDKATGYKLDFHSKKYSVNVTSEFAQRVRHLGMGYSLQKKSA